MFFHVKDLETRSIPFETRFQPGQIGLLDSRLEQKSAIEASGRAELSGSLEEIRVRGRISGSLTGECDRCLESVSLPVAGDFKLSYLPASAEADVSEKGITEEEAEAGYYDGPGIDLIDVVREQILLWIPEHILCRPDCKGICPMCGANRNRQPCQCQPPRVDPRWSALEKLKAGESDAKS